MNRDFFPRFYDTKAKEMVDWQVYMQTAFNRLDENQPFGLLYNLLKNPNVVMLRSTGLEDTNGKIIYQNDIIEDTLGKRYTIEWCQDKLGFVARCDNPNEILESLDITCLQWKIVGTTLETKQTNE